MLTTILATLKAYMLQYLKHYASMLFFSCVIIFYPYFIMLFLIYPHFYLQNTCILFSIMLHFTYKDIKTLKKISFKKNMTKEKFNELKKELEEELDIIINEDDLDSMSLDDIEDYINDNNMLDGEIIYYHNAIEFLKENDASLYNSLEIAEELGYSPKDLNSEILASLLKTRMNEETFYNIIKKYEDED